MLNALKKFGKKYWEDGGHVAAFFLAAAVLLVLCLPAQSQTLMEELNAKANEHRSPIEFTFKEVDGKLLLAVPKGDWTDRARYPDLLTEIRRQWHAKNPGRELYQCQYEGVLSGNATCGIYSKSR